MLNASYRCASSGRESSCQRPAAVAAKSRCTHHHHKTTHARTSAWYMNIRSFTCFARHAMLRLVWSMVAVRLAGIHRLRRTGTSPDNGPSPTCQKTPSGPATRVSYRRSPRLVTQNAPPCPSRSHHPRALAFPASPEPSTPHTPASPAPVAPPAPAGSLSGTAAATVHRWFKAVAGSDPHRPPPPPRPALPDPCLPAAAPPCPPPAAGTASGLLSAAGHARERLLRCGRQQDRAAEGGRHTVAE